MAKSFDTDSSAAPFTEAQIEYLAERDGRLVQSCGHAFRKGIRHLRNGAVIGFLILLGGIGGAFLTTAQDSDQSRQAIVQSGRVVSVFGCNRDYVTVQRLRAVLERSLDFQRVALKRGDITLDQFLRAQAYFQVQLKGLPPVDCRSSATLITDDPNNLPPVPPALHPPEAAVAPGLHWTGPH